MGPERLIRYPVKYIFVKVDTLITPSDCSQSVCDLIDFIARIQPPSRTVTDLNYLVLNLKFDFDLERFRIKFEFIVMVVFDLLF
jgi:hypothetical protein